MSVTKPAKVAVLILLLSVLAVMLQHQYGPPGQSLIDRVRARPVVLEFDSLDLKTTPADIRQAYHNLNFTCTSEHGPLGDHVCWAPVSQFQTVDARIIAFFFRKGHISSVRVSFSPESHPLLFSLLNKRYGPTRRFGTNRDAFGNNIVGWVRPSGVVTTNDNVGPGQEAILLWTSRNEVLAKLVGQGATSRDLESPERRQKEASGPESGGQTSVAGGRLKIRRYEAPGNLESKHDIGCVAADRIENKYTPTDLFKAMSKCVDSERYKEAALLFVIASTYSRFDTLRVTDKTAHQAERVARMQALASMDKKRQSPLRDSLEYALGGPDGLAATCRELTRIGPPDYHPRYMIQHGMGAFLGHAGDGLAKDFDARAAWTNLLSSFLRCA